MRYALAAVQFLCLVALWPGRRYRITLVYLMLAIPATLAFRAESAWLNSWYPFLAGPVALFRLAAGLEVAHRQTDGFRYWSRLTGSVFLVAGMFAGLAWVQSANPTPLRSFVELRRLLHIFGGAFSLVLEAFWISQGGGLYRRVDRIAAVWTVLALSHGVAGFLSGLGRYVEGDAWLSAAGIYGGIDAACYLGLSLLFRGVHKGAQWCFSSRVFPFFHRVRPASDRLSPE